jgi:hypothetical protein
MKKLLMLIFSLLFSMNAQGEVIGSFSDYVGIGSAGIYPDVELDIILADWEAIARVGSLFDSLRVDETDTGSHFYANASNDPYFHDAVELLTNGEVDGIGAEIGFLECAGTDPCQAGFVGTEANVFFDGNRTDFNGYSIEQIELIVDSVEIYRDDINNRTEALVHFTVNVYDAVPPIIDVSINVQGGLEQECDSPAGTAVYISVSTETADPTSIPFVTWAIDDGLPMPVIGDLITPILSLGHHVITVTAELASGEIDTDTVAVTVLDTQPPDVFAAFVDENSGQVITQASSRDKVSTMVIANDRCDLEPTVTAIVGVSANNSGVFSFDKSRKALSLKSTSDEEDAILSVIATDSSGNVAIENVELRILQ